MRSGRDAARRRWPVQDPTTHHVAADAVQRHEAHVPSVSGIAGISFPEREARGSDAHHGFVNEPAHEAVA